MSQQSFRIFGVNHVGLAPKDPVKARWFFCDVLGIKDLGSELVASQQTNTIMLDPVDRSSGKAAPRYERLEILEPQAGQGPIAKFLDKKGYGIHHIALAVSDVAAAIAHCKQHGVKMVDEAPRPGAHHTLIAFVHPESTGGLLVELVQETR